MQKILDLREELGGETFENWMENSKRFNNDYEKAKN